MSACVSPAGSCSDLHLVEYDEEFNTRFVDEFIKSQKDGAIEIFVLDQVKLRDEVRACKGED